MKHLREFIGERRATGVTMDTLPVDVGRRLRLQRMAFMWRRSDLSERAGVSVQTIKSMEKGEAISSSNLLRIILALNQGGDFLRMLESPNFPNLRAHERYVQLTSSREPAKGITCSSKSC